MHKGYIFAKVRETLHITSVIDLLYFHSMHFQVMSLTATEFHHKHKKKKPDFGKIQNCFKGKRRQFQVTRTLLCLLGYATA